MAIFIPRGVPTVILSGSDLTNPLGIGQIFALNTKIGALLLTWQTVFSAPVSTFNINLDLSLDGVNFQLQDFSTDVNGQWRSAGIRVAKFMRVNNTIVTGGVGKSLTVTFMYL